MTSMNHVVIDISSDEEEDEKRVDYFDLLDGVLNPNGTRLLDPTVKQINEDGDDDCVLLDFDPTAKETAIDTYETDEVLVVGQKGEIACRDFPHPRHACAKYPFKSTTHQTYCDMCHCYVCDTRAPCPYWFSGVPNIDHCHANDKDLAWKNQRKRIRTNSSMLPLPRPVSKPTSTIPHLQRISRHPSVPPVTQFGSIRPSSTFTRGAATQPNTYTRPGHRTEQPRAYLQNPRSQPCTVQSLPNHISGSFKGNPIPQAVTSNPFVCTRRPSTTGVYRPENSVQNIAQSSQSTPAASQGNPQNFVTGYISNVPETHSQMYARQFNRNMYSANVQTTATALSATPYLVVNQQQQQQQQQLGRGNDEVLSELEDWLLDDSATRLKQDFETFVKSLKR